MNSHDLYYIFFTMAVKTICQSGTQFSTFYSHLTFQNHFQNFNMIIEYFVLLSYLKSFHCSIVSSNSTYLFISMLLLSLEYREHIYYFIHISAFLLSPFLTSRNFYFFPPILLIPGSIKCLFTKNKKEVESIFLGRFQSSKLIFPWSLRQ